MKNRLKGKPKGLIFVISGPSGSGKTTLARSLLAHKDLKGNLKKTVSFTTRPKRGAEIDGRDYHYITKKDFFCKLKQNEIIEYTKYLNFYYGTIKSNLHRIIENGRFDALLCLDTKGAFRIKKLYPLKSILIFILPPSKYVLQLRLKKRGRENVRELMKRIRLCKNEIALSKKYDYSIVNKELKLTVKKLKDIIENERIKKRYGL